MKFLATLLTFGGYVLVYAAVAGPRGNGGRFALDPWMGIFYDAYTYGDAASGGGKIGGTTPTAPARPPGRIPPGAQPAPRGRARAPRTGTRIGGTIPPATGGVPGAGGGYFGTPINP